ncbi:MAG: phenylacetate--CoA ligase [Chloroflexi bacterium UTCFX4]|jgi:phenylacetate-CoA ligase|nr:MAG: phenylacetate--CoA ligase [Chloroflexi bacterium UTCFX4]
MPYFDSTIETLPRAQLAALQLRKLQTMLTELWGKNAFYTRKFQAAGLHPDALRSLDDLAQFPFTLKRELIQDQSECPPFGTNLTYPLNQYVRFHQTSGTTGAPLRVLDTAEDWNWWSTCWSYVLSGAGLCADDRLFAAFSFGPFIGFWAAVEGARKIGAMMIPGGGRDSLQRLELMRDAGATAICCTPTYALRLLEVARENNFDMNSLNVRATVHAGEPGASVPETKARIEAGWHAKCFDHAGASEVGAHSFSCESQAGIHLIESEYIAEALDRETGKPVAPGEVGELVITNLGRLGFPIIRYRTGDLVRMNIEPCQCGRTFARFEGGVLGRADDMTTVRGVNVYPMAVEKLIVDFHQVVEYRITVQRVREMDEMDIEVELTDDADRALPTAIAQNIYHALSFRPNVRVVEHGTLPRFELKAKRFFVKK